MRRSRQGEAIARWKRDDLPLIPSCESPSTIVILWIRHWIHRLGFSGTLICPFRNCLGFMQGGMALGRLFPLILWRICGRTEGRLWVGLPTNRKPGLALPAEEGGCSSRQTERVILAFVRESSNATCACSLIRECRSAREVAAGICAGDVSTPDSTSGASWALRSVSTVAAVARWW